jgi:hypothetical protein
MFRKSRIVTAAATLAVSLCALTGIADAAGSSSQVSILGNNGDYYGYVHSSDASHCESNRKVTVFKQLGSTQDQHVDQKIGTDIAQPNGPDGMWSIGNSGFKSGSFYAKAAKVPGFCKAATSPTITR